MGSETRARTRCRRFNVGIVVTVVFVAIIVVMWVAALNCNALDHHLSLGRSFHMGTWDDGWDSRLVFFNDSEYGPYRGSIIQMDGEPPLERRVGFGDRLGIYYRYFRFANDGATVWTLMISLWYPTILFVVLVILWWIRYWRAANEK